ncbi:MAG: biotin/lipoyl-containing protein [Planctomycetota bacterium]
MEEVLLRSRRRCCTCFYLSGRDEQQAGQIAHLRGRDNDNPEDLAFLCPNHHNELDRSESQVKGLTTKEIRTHRAKLYEHIEGSSTPVDVTVKVDSDRSPSDAEFVADLLEEIRKRAKTGSDMQVLRVTTGCLAIELQCTADDTQKLSAAFESGLLEDLGVTHISIEDSDGLTPRPTLVEIRVQDLGEGLAEARAIAVHMKPGERIDEDQAIIELGYDKADIVITSPFDGVAEEVLVKEGDDLILEQVIAKVWTEVPLADLRSKRANIHTGLRWLSQTRPIITSNSGSAGDLSSLNRFLGRTRTLVQSFTRLQDMNNIARLSEESVESIRMGLWGTSHLVREIELWKRKPKKARLDSIWELKFHVLQGQITAHQTLYDALVVAAGELGLAPAVAPAIYNRAPGVPFVYVVVAHEDLPSTKGLIQELQRSRINHLVDDQLIGSSYMLRNGMVHLANASHVIIVLSASSMASRWAPFVLGVAYGSGARVVPFKPKGIRADLHDPEVSHILKGLRIESEPSAVIHAINLEAS